jgi:hypothetical protein
MTLFRAIAIVGSEERLGHLLDLLYDFFDIAVGIMLRDPEHRAARVRQLAGFALQRRIPSHLTLIANGVPVDGIPLTHLTSSQLGDLTPSGAAPDASIFGCSTHSLDEAVRAENAGARYITFGPVFPTASKPGHPGVGLDMLSAVSRSISIPVFALGGISERNIQACLDAGSHGIASISLFESGDREALERAFDLLRKLG